MKLNKDLLQLYNSPDTIIVVSSYPKKNETYSKGVCAVASFTKNTLESIKEQNPSKKIVVLTMILDKEEIYEEGNTLIIRCFSRNKPLSYFSLASYTKRFNLVKNVLVGFEFASFGDTLTTGLFSIFIWTLRFMGKRVTLVIHQVIFDISKLSGHIGVSVNSPLIGILNRFLMFYYKIITIPVDNIVVLEDNLKKRLSAFVKSDKIHVIPHGVHASIQNSSLTKQITRKELGIHKNEFVILYYGYMTWYKGVDFLVKAFKNMQTINNKNVRLILAGGPSFTQSRKKHYQNFYQKLNQSIKNIPHITLTGFISEEKIPSYFESSDLVVFPYRTFMSSSGSLATALSFEKPFLLSKNLGEILDSSDIVESLISAQVSKKELLFDLTEKSFVGAVTNAMNPIKYEKLQQLSILLKDKRSFKNLSLNYSDLLFPQTVEKPSVALALE